MLKKELLDNMLKKIGNAPERIKTDSREILPGDIFVAIKGTMHDGHDNVNEVIDKGALCAVCDKGTPGGYPHMRDKIVEVEDTKKALGYMAMKVYGDPSDVIPVYGVTGTNGKTTTVFLIDSILEFGGIKSGLISTVCLKVGSEKEKANMTTPDVMSINRHLSRIVSTGGEAAVIEISSHALSQKRSYGIKLASAVFTNITPEHLDYHENMENYLRDKVEIFDSLAAGGNAVVNIDDPLIKAAVEDLDLPGVITFGLSKDSDVRVENLMLSSFSSEFDLYLKDKGIVHIKTGMIGRHNVYNIMAAAGALLSSDLSLEVIKGGIEKAASVPGRLENVNSNAPFRVLVDYAHTPNALESVINCLKPLTNGDLICVFGCGGDRDKLKRPVMGSIATKLCDKVVMTSDNPRSEDPASILNEIEKGVSNKNNYSIMEKRYEAIEMALKTAEEGDVVLIAGKGHEDYQIIGDDVLHFDDREVAREILTKLGY